MAKILKWWHQYGFIVTIVGYIFMMGAGYKGYADALASIQTVQADMKDQHKAENLDHRVTVLEQIATDNKEAFSEIRDTNKAIFQRLNQIQDDHHGR